MGHPAIDHYLSSDLVEIDGADAHYSEKLVRLPSLLAYQRRSAGPTVPATKSEFGFSENAHIYACLQRPLKIHPDFDALLAGILGEDERGLVVLLKNRTGASGDLLSQRFRASMPDVCESIVLFPWLDHDRYLRLLSLAEVVLDPLHYGVGSSAYDIFSLNLPLVTLPGRYNASRYAQACYRRMGLSDLVASDAIDYVAKATRFGKDAEYRASMRDQITQRSEALFEDPSVVKAFEEHLAAAVAGRQ